MSEALVKYVCERANKLGDESSLQPRHGFRTVVYLAADVDPRLAELERERDEAVKARTRSAQKWMDDLINLGYAHQQQLAKAEARAQALEEALQRVSNSVQLVLSIRLTKLNPVRKGLQAIIDECEAALDQEAP